MDFKLEICVDSIESAINAQDAGADRIELCGNLSEGGITPSFGMTGSVRSNLSIGLHVIIRPRGGDFLYSDAEFDIMRRDIEMCGEAGVDGVALGILRADGSIDKERTSKLTELAHPMSVTFHRAYDLCSDPFIGLQDVIETGASRLLTSGQKNLAEEGTELIKELVRQAGDRIIIMPGSGLSDLNIGEIAKRTGAREFHLSGRKTVDSRMTFRRETIKMGYIPGMPEYSGKVADTEKIKNIIKILKMI
jgi:copper homeostasis protein